MISPATREVPVVVGGNGGTIPPFVHTVTADQVTLLASVSLRLSPECKVVSFCRGHLVVKQVPGRTYLNLSEGQWEALRAFGELGLTVPQVLFQLISDRRCPPLREFYEVVVKAVDAGILEPSGGGAGSASGNPAASWVRSVSPEWIPRLILFSSLLALAGLAMHPFELPGSAMQLFAGWLLVCLTQSLGYALGACVARHCGAEVYRPRFEWKTPFPHFSADLGDAVMGGREAEFMVAAARLAPGFVALGLVPFFDPGISLVLVCDLLFNLSPFWWSPGLMLMHARYSSPRLDAFRKFRFEPNRVIWAALRLRMKGTDTRFLRIHAALALGWLGLVLLTGSLLLSTSALELWTAYVKADGLHFTALALLGLLGLMVAGVVAALAWFGLREGIRRFARWVERHRRPAGRELTRETMSEAVSRSLLFQSLAPADREALIGHLKAEEHGSRALVVREGDPGERLYLVMSGQVEVLRNLPSGRMEPVARLEPGDIFGEIALLEAGGRRTRSVRTRSRAVFLTLDRDAFQNLVLTKLSRQEVLDIVQKVAFLHRVPLSANWSPHAMFSFARRCVFQTCKEDEILIEEDQDNQFFFVLYEGTLTVSKKGREVARLHAGDFFGEISALQNSVASATIRAMGPAKCLVMSKREFLQFLVNDFCIGLQFEAISSKRLGHPLFPLPDSAFDLFR
jgi:CRP-like cAMP-binding protein